MGQKFTNDAELTTELYSILLATESNFNSWRSLDTIRAKAQCAAMTTVMAVAAAVAFSFALGSLIRQVDGATLRRWRLSRRWDVSRLAREFIAAADEPLANLRGLMHMINAWERGARRPSERYWLLYLRIFPECVIGETPDGSTEINAMDTTPLSSARGRDSGDVRALAATVKSLEQQIAGLSRRLDELSRDGHGEGEPHEKRTAKSGNSRWIWTPLWIALMPSLVP